MAQSLILYRPHTESQLTVPVDTFGKTSKPLDDESLIILQETYYPDWEIDGVLETEN